MVALVGQSARFICGASGKPLPTFEWLYNDVQVSNSSKFNIQITQLESRLTVHDLQPSDQGTVVCVVENNVTAEGVINEKVKSKPANLIVRGLFSLIL